MRDHLDNKPTLEADERTEEALLHVLDSMTAGMEDQAALTTISRAMSRLLVKRGGTDGAVRLHTRFTASLAAGTLAWIAGVEMQQAATAMLARRHATVPDKPAAAAAPVEETRNYTAATDNPWRPIDTAPVDDERELLLKCEGEWEGARATLHHSGTWIMLSPPQHFHGGRRDQPLSDPTGWRFSGEVVEKNPLLDVARDVAVANAEPSTALPLPDGLPAGAVLAAATLDDMPEDAARPGAGVAARIHELFDGFHDQADAAAEAATVGAGDAVAALDPHPKTAAAVDHAQPAA